MCDQLQNQIFVASFDLCNVLVIIPVRNEEATIAMVIQNLRFGLVRT
jgi:hypothetical protein